jgi:hypothetical protein
MAATGALTALINLLGSLAEIFAHKIKNEHREKYLELKRRFYVENTKDYLLRDHAALDSIERELCELVPVFSAELQGSNALPSSGQA